MSSEEAGVAEPTADASAPEARPISAQPETLDSADASPESEPQAPKPGSNPASKPSSVAGSRPVSAQPGGGEAAAIPSPAGSKKGSNMGSNLPSVHQESEAGSIYAASEVENSIIHRSFHTGNYDFLKHLPDSLKEQQVMATRQARMEAARRFLSPLQSGPLIKGAQDNQQGLFQAFEYMPSRFGLADELESKEFIPSGADAAPLKHKDFTAGKLYPYMGGPHEALADAELATAWLQEGKALGPTPFVQAGTDKLTDKPTKQMSWDMMTNLRKWIVQNWEGAQVDVFENDQDCMVLRFNVATDREGAEVDVFENDQDYWDWEGAEVDVFENDQDCWVIRCNVASVDSVDGLKAYMNVFIRCNELVVEFWNVAPGDGNIYYVVRPPWVRSDKLTAFFSLFPLTTAGVLEVQRTQASKDPMDEKYPPNSMASSALRFDSRLEWGVNFMTGTPAPASQAKMFGGGTSQSTAATALQFDSRREWGVNFRTGTPAIASQAKMSGGGTSVNPHK
eukprot:gene26089-11797_t